MHLSFLGISQKVYLPPNIPKSATPVESNFAIRDMHFFFLQNFCIQNFSTFVCLVHYGMIGFTAC
jgi:hypothetical protein